MMTGCATYLTNQRPDSIGVLTPSDHSHTYPPKLADLPAVYRKWES